MLLCAACQSGSGSSSGSSATGLATGLTPSPSPISTSVPVALPRPTNLPTDGTCEQNQICLGLLTSGRAYHTSNFLPRITFTVPSSGWENLSDELPVFQLLRIAAPGDAIAFFRGARAVNADGSAAEVAATVPAIAAWLRGNELLTVTPPKSVTVGGLAGVTLDIVIAPGVVNHPGDCPVQACVPLLRGDDPKALPPWHWDWASAGTERQRLYLLQATDTVIAIFVDSYDGKTFDSLTADATPILHTLRLG